VTEAQRHNGEEKANKENSRMSCRAVRYVLLPKVRVKEGTDSLAARQLDGDQQRGAQTENTQKKNKKLNQKMMTIDDTVGRGI